jgi:putative redox protein
MAEKIFFRQANTYETEVRSKPEGELDESAQLQPVSELVELNPYGMLLVGLAGCTSAVLHTYAQNHRLDLREVEITVTYDRVFKEDCDNCENIDRYEELIDEQICLVGDLSQEQREKLFQISHHCPIQKMLISGVEVKSSLVE